MNFRMLFLFSIVLLMTITGCSLPAGSTRINSSHFVFPNSNVISLNQTTEGIARKFCGILFVSWNGFTPETTERAYMDALEEVKGDLLINANESRNIFMIPNLFQICTTRVVGTVAKMQVGIQELK